MFHRILGKPAMVIASLGLLLAAGVASAQQGVVEEMMRGLGRNAPTYGTPTYAAPWYGAATYGAPTYAAPVYALPAYSMPAYTMPPYMAYVFPSRGRTTTQSFYPETGNSTASSGAVEINVVAPAEAQIWLALTPTTQHGAVRRFMLPPVVSGRATGYQVKAEWTENGQPVTRTRNITVHAGEVVNVDFNATK